MVEFRDQEKVTLGFRVAVWEKGVVKVWERVGVSRVRRKSISGICCLVEIGKGVVYVKIGNARTTRTHMAVM